MNIKELKELINNLPDDMEIVGSCYIEQGRGGSYLVTDDVVIHHDEEFTSFDPETGDDTEPRNVLVIKIDGEATFDE